MESWGVTKDDAIWATEDEYSRWNKKSRLNSNSNSNSNSTSKAIGRMFYKTKLCCKYRSGTCPYVTNCNFAHGLDELRNPPENWQEIVAAHDEEQHQNQNQNQNQNHNNNHSEQQHLQQIPIISTTESRGESHHSQRSYKGRHCKKFYTQEGCPYGDSCTFLHDEQSRSRESVAISVTPALAPPSAVVVGGGSASSSSVNVNSVKPSNWKTRICNKWETTGTCPFGPKCHFAHGWPELHNFGGGTTEGDCRESPAATETKTAAGMAIKTDAAPTASLEHHHHNHHHVGGGITSQRPSMVIKVVGRRPHPKWKGPDKISRIYGDWIGDIE